MTDHQTLVQSKRLAFFQREPSIYLYHDLVGYILEMDETVLELLRHFQDPSTVEEARTRFSDRWRPEELDNFIDIFIRHSCLVPADQDEEAALLGYYPIVGPWVVYYHPRPSEVIVACKHRHWQKILLMRLDRIESLVWECSRDGERSIQDIIDEARKIDASDLVAERVKAAVFRWTHSDYQLLKLSRHPVYERIGSPEPYLRSVMPYAPYEGSVSPAPEVADLRDYHKDEIEDASVQFDIEETTLSHMFRVPHAALSGRTYGGAFAERVQADGALRPGITVHEIGGGVGFFSRSFLDRLEQVSHELYESLSYQILDLSVVLQDAQRMLNLPLGEKVRYVLGDAHALPYADKSVHLAISNEVVADLETVQLSRDDLTADPTTLPEARRNALCLMRELAVECDDAPGTFYVNFGALKLVKELDRTLAPGGHAYLVEYGDVYKYPVQSTHLDHAEFSIHFGHLLQAARTLGFECDLIPIGKFLDWDPQVRVLSTTRSHFELLRALLSRKGVRLEKIAYSEQMFRDLIGDRFDMDRIHKLEFRPVDERALGLRTAEFKVLHLVKPAGTSKEPTNG